jgi:hypothetical protein
MTTIHKGYIITFFPKPLPTRAYDFDYQHKDYDGAPDSGDYRCGSAASIRAAIEDINDIESLFI